MNIQQQLIEYKEEKVSIIEQILREHGLTLDELLSFDPDKKQSILDKLSTENHYQLQQELAILQKEGQQ